MTRRQRARSRFVWSIALALLIAALAATGAVAAKPKVLKDAWGATLPELTYGTSVAVAPDGTPWFGVEDSAGPLLLSRQENLLATDYLQGERRERPISITSDLRFDSAGNLWFVKRHGHGPETIVRRAVDGSLSESSVPTGDWVTSLAVAPGGEAWFAIDGKGRRFGFISPAGAITRLPLPGGVFPRSLVAGPDGAIWFVDGPYAKVGRVTAKGAVRLFPLGAGVAPDELVAGSDGALWFSENGRRGRNGERAARIGRVTTSGRVTQFRVPFGHRTEKLAATPEGSIWFSTDEDELSSISTSGAIGPHGCLEFSCRAPIVALAGGPDGSVWFALAHVFKTCGECGGGAQLLLDNEGAPVGQVAAPRSASALASLDTGVHFPNAGGCTDPGKHHGYCASLHLLNLKIGPYFELKSFEGPGRAKLCPRAAHVPESCFGRKLRYDGEDRAWIARVLSFRAIKQSGCYTIRWVDPATGHRLGPKLHFIASVHEKDRVPCLRETDETA